METTILPFFDARISFLKLKYKDFNTKFVLKIFFNTSKAGVRYICTSISA